MEMAEALPDQKNQDGIVQVDRQTQKILALKFEVMVSDSTA